MVLLLALRKVVLVVCLGLLLPASSTWAGEGYARLHRLIQDLRSPNTQLRLIAAMELSETIQDYGPAAEAAIPALTAALNDKDILVSSSAAIALGEIGPAAVPVLIAALRTADSPVKDAGRPAAEALVKIGPAAVPGLIEVLRDENVFVRIWAATALEKIGPAAIPALITALKEPEVNVRSEAADVLARIGPGAEAAIPGLVAALRHKDLGFDSAVLALQKIGPASVPALIEALKDNDERLRFAAAFILPSYGLHAKPAISPLIQALKGKEWNVRFAAALALVEIDLKAAQAAIPVLTESLKHTNEKARQAAQEALKKIQQK